MGNKRFNLEIYTPDRTFFKGEIESLTVSTTVGKLGILYNTLPVVSILKKGSIRFLQNNKWSEAHTLSGFISVRKDATVILAESCRWPHEPEEDLTVTEVDIEDEKLRKKESMREYQMAKARLAIQFAKLRKRDKDL